MERADGIFPGAPEQGGPGINLSPLIDHSDTPTKFANKRHDIKHLTLAQAVKRQVEDRVFPKPWFSPATADKACASGCSGSDSAAPAPGINSFLPSVATSPSGSGDYVVRRYPCAQADRRQRPVWPCQPIVRSDHETVPVLELPECPVL